VLVVLSREEVALVIADVDPGIAENNLIQRSWNELGEGDPWQIVEGRYNRWWKYEVGKYEARNNLWRLTGIIFPPPSERSNQRKNLD